MKPNLKLVVGALSLSALLAACGQGPALEEQQNPQRQFVESIPVEGSFGTAVALEAENTNGTDGANGSNGNNGTNGTGTDGANGTNGTPTIIAGPAGERGERGEAGAAGCKEAQPFTASFSVRPITTEEAQNIAALPYQTRGDDPLKKLKHRIDPINLGKRTGTANGNPYVSNRQVVFAIDAITLPPQDAIVSIDRMALHLDLTKVSLVSEARFTSSELICLVDERVCSGALTDAPSWMPTINPAFFENGGGLVANPYFGTQYLDRELARNGNRRLHSAEAVLEIEKLLEGSSLTPMQMLYGANAKDKPVRKRTLRFVVADDTYVGLGSKLNVSLVENGCKTLALSQGGAQ